MYAAQHFGWYTTYDAPIAKAFGNYRTGGYHAIVANGYAVQYGYFAAYPAVVAYNDALAGYTLQAIRLCWVVRFMIFGMATQVLAHNTIVANLQTATTAQIGEFANTYIVAYADANAGIGYAARCHKTAIGTNAYIVAQRNAGDAGSVHVYVFAQFQKAAPMQLAQAMQPATLSLQHHMGVAAP
jgi:hypothetical protein